MENFDYMDEASVLIKKATEAFDTNQAKAISLIKEAIELCDYIPFYIKLSNYHLKSGQSQLAIFVLENKIKNIKQEPFSGTLDMSLGILYGHSALQLGRLQLFKEAVITYIISTLYLGVGLAVQGRESELNHLLTFKHESDYYNKNFWKYAKKIQTINVKIGKTIDDLLIKIEANIDILLTTHKQIERVKAVRDEDLESNYNFMAAYRRTESMNFEKLVNSAF